MKREKRFPVYRQVPENFLFLYMLFLFVGAQFGFRVQTDIVVCMLIFCF